MGFLVLSFYDYLRTTGFLAFSHGIEAYSQYKNLFLIQSADFAGVWALDYLMIFTSCLVFHVIQNCLELKKNKELSFNGFLKANYISLSIYALLVIGFYVYGFVRLRQKESVNDLNKVKICLIQNNSDPWEEGFEVYKNQIDTLKRLTDSALLEHPDVEIVVWPETAVIPAIQLNYSNPEETSRKKLIVSLLEYMESKNCDFVIGNFNSQGDKDYNSVYHFVPGQNVIPPSADFYSKIHLVPFSEYFPIIITGVVDEKDLWTPGVEYKVFSRGDFSFSTPVCFEDNFGNDLRAFVLNGCRCFINLTNDSWASSLRSQEQHLSMAVFRSVENGVYTARSTASGETCIISGSGKILNRAEPFKETYICDYVYYSRDGLTVYTEAGDFLPFVMLVLIVAGTVALIFVAIRRKLRYD